jgi:peptidoglycan hydrolase-like protein with peptidoglycan-binding domain
MNLRDCELTVNMPGDDVAEFHLELTALGLAIQDAEVVEQVFGPTTRRAVFEFQERAGLPATGEVHERSRMGHESFHATCLESTFSLDPPKQRPNWFAEGETSAL